MSDLDMRALRDRPDFKLLLEDLRDRFLEYVTITGTASQEDVDLSRGVMSFIADQYEAYAGKTILGDPIDDGETQRKWGYGAQEDSG